MLKTKLSNQNKDSQCQLSPLPDFLTPMKYLASRPGRFIYVHTPKQGSRLNLIDSTFSKMARTFLRHIRVSSKAELKERILKGIDEINSTPVIYRWKKFDLGIS